MSEAIITTITLNCYALFDLLFEEYEDLLPTSDIYFIQKSCTDLTPSFSSSLLACPSLPIFLECLQLIRCPQCPEFGFGEQTVQSYLCSNH